jgi:hypothetical protein
MKKLIIALACLLLVGAAAAYWFFHRDSDKARDVLPEDATAVAVLEPAELIQGLGLKQDKLMKLFVNYEDLFEALDLAKPVYAFSTEKGVTGITLNIKDADKLLKTISSYGIECEEHGGLQWLAGSGGIGCMDRDKVLLCDASSSTAPDALRDEMAKLMSQDRKEVEALDKASKQDGVFRMSTPLGGIPEQYARQLPAGVSDAILNAALQIGKKDISLSANLTTDFSSLPLAPIKGSLAGIGPEKPFLWVCFNMNGERLLPLLREVPQLRSILLALNMNVDVDMMLKAINGDVSIAVPKLDLQRPDFILTASLANTDFLKNAGDWSMVRKVGASDFAFEYEGLRAFFGVRGNMLYMASNDKMAENAFAQAPKDAFQSAAKGKYLCASLNIGQVIDAYPGLAILLRTMPQVRDLADAFDRVSLTADSPQSLELSIETRKPVKDIISSLLTLVTGE